MYTQIACIQIHFRPELFNAMEYRLYVLRLYNPCTYVCMYVIVGWGNDFCHSIQREKKIPSF
jgi:hypothetical protein